MEGLRPLVGDNGWDYCIFWKLSQDQRFLEWMGCCCGGTEASVENGGCLLSCGASAEKSACRDLMLQHPRTRACDALSLFPPSIPLDSSLGIYAQVLMSNQATWQAIHPSPHATVGTQTRVLVPIQGGLVELFASKQVSEDQHTIAFIMSQCNATSYEQACAADFLEDAGCDYASKNGHTWMSSSQQMMPADHQNFQWDPTSVPDQSQLYNSSPLNLFDGSVGGQAQMESTISNVAYQQSLITSMVGGSPVAGQEKESVKTEAGRAESGSEGSEDDDDPRPVGRNGKRHHSKNLMAERKRRKKLNDRLYALRALVPKITKMDRASILGDAIEYVMDLQKQVKDLQDELENDQSNNPDDIGEGKQQNESNYEMEMLNGSGLMAAHGSMELDESPNSAKAANGQLHNVEEKGNQMEPQVEVKQLEANEFYLKIFCEHKAGGFARLMEAMSSLGLEVTNATVTTLQTLVLNVFNGQKRDNEMVQVEQVRDSLLELTRGPAGGWPEQEHAAANGGVDYQHESRNHRRSHHQHHLQLNSHPQLHFLHHQP